MPQMTILGWLHTVFGVFAVLSGFYTLYKHKFISLNDGAGKLYVFLTLIVAGSALGIYNQGGFGLGHILALFTFFALLVGVIMERIRIFGNFSKYFQALGYTTTLLFHMIPAITDFLRRLPVGDPFVGSFNDPILINFLLTIILIYLLGISIQLLSLKNHGK